MQMRPLGATGLRVTPLGLGLAALGRPGYINLGHAGDLGRDYDPAAMELHCHTMLDEAWAAGVRYFDAARSYGRAEEFLASWLARRVIGPGEITVGSKWGYTYTADWKVDADRHEVKDHSAAVLRRQSEESRALLGPYLKLYQIHSATLDSGALDRPDVLAELARLRAGGWKIGLSVSGVSQGETILRALDVKADGVPLFACVQATWNLLERSAGPALKAAHEAGRGVIIKEALANGRLTARNAEPEFAPRRRLLEAEAQRLGCTLDALALAAVLTQPWVDVVLSGAATTEQLASNVAALSVPWGEESAETLRGVAESPEDYWATRARLTWN